MQKECNRCQAELLPQSSYCERCGERTERARRLVRIAIRAELLALLLVIVMVLGFAYVYSSS